MSASSSALVSLVCPDLACARHHSLKKALLRATLPKATLLFSLLQPSVKLLLKIPRCTAASAHPSHPMVQRLILGQWLQQMPYRQRSPSRFCFHFFSFTFFLLFSLHFFPLFFSPSEFTIEMMA